jgi:hypothetical protein
MAEDFFLVTGACFVSGETKPSGKFVVATSEIASIERGQGGASVLVLNGGERFCVLEPYAELSKALALPTRASVNPSPGRRDAETVSRVSPSSFTRSR